jgi:hypothetical protein
MEAMTNRRFSFVEPSVEPQPLPSIGGPNPNSYPAPQSTVRLFLYDGRIVEKAWWDSIIQKFYGYGSLGWSCGPGDVQRWEYSLGVCPGPGYAEILGTPLHRGSDLTIAIEQERARWRVKDREWYSSQYGRPSEVITNLSIIP